MTFFAVFLGIIAGLLFLSLIALLITLIVMAVRSRGKAVRPTYRD
jgi:hypothetical protein